MLFASVAVRNHQRLKGLKVSHLLTLKTQCLKWQGVKPHCPQGLLKMGNCLLEAPKSPTWPHAQLRLCLAFSLPPLVCLFLFSEMTLRTQSHRPRQPHLKILNSDTVLGKRSTSQGF